VSPVKVILSIWVGYDARLVGCSYGVRGLIATAMLAVRATVEMAMCMLVRWVKRWVWSGEIVSFGHDGCHGECAQTPTPLTSVRILTPSRVGYRKLKLIVKWEAIGSSTWRRTAANSLSRGQPSQL